MIHETSTPEAALVERIAGTGQEVRTPFEGGSIAWRIFGKGPALLLLHGGYGSWTHWLRNLEDLGRDYRLLVPDMPGFGASDRPADLEGPDHLAGLIGAGVDQLLAGERLQAAVGFSFGGVIAGHLAHGRPDLVARLVLVGAGGLGLTRPPMAPLLNWRDARDADDFVRIQRTNLATLMIHDPARIDSLAVHLQVQNIRRGRVRSRPISLAGTLRRILPEVQVPLAGIWGEHDATAAGHLDERCDLLRSCDPTAPFHVVAGGGHWIQYELPEAFNRALRAVLGQSR